MDKNIYSSPFKGARSYEEKDASSFYGRFNEIDELVDRIDGNFLTVLYGKSGIGKSSLIKAGAIPELRRLNYLPIYITLDNSSDETYESQIIRLITEKIQEETTLFANNEFNSLIDFFDILNWQNNLCPVIILDQFEELYYHHSSYTKRISLLSSLHSLIYNKIEKGQISSDYRLITDFRVLISFREDFLCYIEDDSTYLPPLRENRYRLLPLTDTQAHDIITCVGEENGIISPKEELSAKIIKKICREGDSESTSNAKDTTIDAFTLSLYCQQLDNLRYSKHLKYISGKLVDETSPSEILFSYYKTSLKNKSQNCTLLIEDSLLDDEGRKKKIHKDSAYNIGVKPTDLTELISEGIIRETDNGLIEIGHDRICEVAFRNKAMRLENREKWIYYFILFPFYAFIAFSVYYLLNAIMSQIGNVLDWLDLSINGKEPNNQPLKFILANFIYLSALYTLPSAVLGYVKRWSSVRWFSIFSLGILTFIIWWHCSIFLGTDNKPVVFPYNNDLSIIWISIYAGTFGILAILIVLSILFPGNIKNRKKEYINLFSGRILLETPAAIIYTVLILIMCLIICVIPQYNKVVTSEEAVAIMIMITYLLSTLTSKIPFVRYVCLFSSVYFILFCYGGEPQDHILRSNMLIFTIGIGLLCLSAYTLFHSARFSYFIKRNSTVRQKYGLLFLSLCSLCLIVIDQSTYLIGIFMLFGVLDYAQFLIWGKYSSKIRHTLYNVCAFIILTIIYIGYNPISVGLKVSNMPLYKTMNKWDYIVMQRDSLYGLSDAISGKEVIPCVFDSVGRGCLIMKLPRNGEEFLDSTVDINHVDQLKNSAISSGIYRLSFDSSGFYFSYPILLDKTILQTEGKRTKAAVLASKLYFELRDALLVSLRSSNPLDSIQLSYAKDLFEEESILLDSILIRIVKRESSKGSELISEMDLKEYTLHMARQLSVASIIDAITTKRSNLCMWEFFNTFSSTYYADIYDICRIHSQWNVGLNLNGNSEQYNFTSEGVRNGEFQSLFGLWKDQYATNLKYMSYNYQLMMDESKQTLVELSDFGSKTNMFLNYELQQLSLGVYRGLEDISDKMKSGKMIEALMDILKTSKKRYKTIEQVQYDFQRYFVLRDSVNKKPLMAYRNDTTYVDRAAYKNFERLDVMNEMSVYNYGAIKSHYIDNVILLSMNMKSPNNAVGQLEQRDSVRNGNTYNFLRSFTFLSNMYEIQKAEITAKGNLVQDLLDKTKELLDKMPFSH